MTGSEIRRLFLEYFGARDHLVLPSAPLVPQGDPTTLFISAGMQPLQPYFQGVEEPPAPKLASCQKCFRTPDLEEVGKTDRHGTFFEMLGNFAPTGAYFKAGAIAYAWEFLTLTLRLDKERLRVTTHPTDEQARQLWRETTDIRPAWIYENEENWWGLASGLGPCGPDSEIWWDRGRDAGCGQEDCPPDHCDRYLEIWNLVFPQFDAQVDGSLQPLPKPGIDTGSGLERVASAVQGRQTVFETDLYADTFEWIRGNAREQLQLSERVVADHLRAMTFLVADGVRPSNEGRGYVLRRIIRRAQLHARRLGVSRPLVEGMAQVATTYQDQYPDLGRAATADVVPLEVQRFERSLEQGMERFEKLAEAGAIGGVDAFALHDTFGFPFELTLELAEERSLPVDEAGFYAAMTAQRERSRQIVKGRWSEARGLPRAEFTGYHELESDARVELIRRDGEEVGEAVEGDEVEVYLDRTPFYAEQGGQIGDTGRVDGPSGSIRVEDVQRPAEGISAHLGVVATGSVKVGDAVTARVDAPRRRRIARHHSATHLLHKALRETLGEDAVQRGSWVGPDHTTFDFALPRAMTQAEIRQVSGRVSEQVRAALPFHESIKPYREAVAEGAMHLFEEKYGDQVRVVCFGDWSCELCGGTHVASSADVGATVILSESSIGAGLRRIDMAAGEAADELVAGRLGLLVDLGRALGVPPDGVPARVEELRAELRQADKRIERLQDELRVAQVQGGAGVRRLEARVPVGVGEVAAEGMDDLRGYADRYLEAIGGRGVVAVTGGGNFVIKVSRDLASDGVDATKLKDSFGHGGGRADLVQGKLTEQPETAFAALAEALK
ncbi:MAG TPA: alanine--tRNA ligase [Candidatus Dormibacteraeota bacterium]